MAFTQSDIDTLKKAIASGVKRVTFADRTTEFQDIPAMIKALKLMEAEVAAASPTGAPNRGVLIQHGRGV